MLSFSVIPAPYKYLAVAIALIAAYAVGRHDGNTITEGAAAREERIAQVALDKATVATADALSKMEVKNVTIRQTMQREIIREPVYRDCKHSADGLRSVNEALSGSTLSPGDRKLSGPDTPKR